MQNADVMVTRGDQCQLGLQALINGKYGDVGAAMKPAGFMSNSWCIIEKLCKRCLGNHDHVHFMGDKASAAARCPRELCDAICQGIANQ